MSIYTSHPELALANNANDIFNIFFPHREYDLYTQKEMPELHYNNTIRCINSAKYLCHLCCRSYYDYKTFKEHITSEYYYSKYYKEIQKVVLYVVQNLFLLHIFQQ